MIDSNMRVAVANGEDWRPRPWLYALTGALWGVFMAVNLDTSPWLERTITATGFALLLMMLTLEKHHFWLSVLHAILGGAGLALLLSLTGINSLPSSPAAIASYCIGFAVSVPFIQTWIDTSGRQTTKRLPYTGLHDNAWGSLSGVILAAFFALLSWLTAKLLATLLSLVNVGFLEKWLELSSVSVPLFAAAFGCALALLIERRGVLASIRTLVLRVVAVLAPFVAVGILLFLVIMPFAGVEVFWNSGDRPSVVLLLSVAVSLVLVNAVIRDTSDNAAKSKVLLLGARILALSVVPLAALAAFGMQLRIEESGLTPLRIWGCTVIFIACVYGLFYLFGSLLARSNWMTLIRQGNIVLALTTTTVAIIVPWLPLSSIATNDQLRRFEQGKITPDKLDVASLAHKFGPVGRESLEALLPSGDEELDLRIASALEAGDYYSAREITPAHVDATKVLAKLQILPAPVSLPESLQQLIAAETECDSGVCGLYWPESSDAATLIFQYCFDPQSSIAPCVMESRHYALDESGRWQHSGINDGLPQIGIPQIEKPRTVGQKQPVLTVQEVTRLQFLLDGEPVGTSFPASAKDKATGTE